VIKTTFYLHIYKVY